MSGYDDGGSGGGYPFVAENPFRKIASNIVSSFASYQIQFHGFPANQRVSQIPCNKILFPVPLNPTINPFEGFAGSLGLNQDDQSFGYGDLDLDDTTHKMCESHDEIPIRTLNKISNESRIRTLHKISNESRIRTLNKIRGDTRDDTRDNKSMKSLADYFKN